MIFEISLVFVNLLCLKFLFLKFKKLNKINYFISNKLNIIASKKLKNSENEKIKFISFQKKYKENELNFKNLQNEKNKIFKNFENEKKLKMILFGNKEKLKKQNKMLLYQINAIDNILLDKNHYYNLKYTSKIIDKVFKLS